MQINKNYLGELKFKDLFFHVLYRWRSILLIALACALVLGGTQYLNDRKRAGNAGEAPEEPKLTAVGQFRSDLLEGRRGYLQESPYIRLDAKNVWTAEKTWLVKAGEGETVSADSILQAYAAPLAGAGDAELEEAFGTSVYAGELVRVTLSGESDTVNVRVQGADRETVEKGMAFVSGRIEAISAGKAKEAGSHELLVLSEGVSAGPDAELAKKQEELLRFVADEEKEAEKDNERLSGERSSWQAQVNGAAAQASLGPAVKKAVLGFVLAAVLMAALYVVLYAVNGRMKGAEEITGKYGVPVLGECFRSASKHKGKGLDGLLEKLEGKNRVPADAEAQDRLASLAEGWEEAGTVGLASTLPEGDLKALEEALKKRRPEKEIAVLADFTRSGKAVAEAAKAGAVVWVEEKGVSRRQEMDQAAETLLAAGAKVKGVFLN